MKWLAYWLRALADRIDYAGSPKGTGWSLTFEQGCGIVFRDDGRGLPTLVSRRRPVRAGALGGRRLGDGAIVTGMAESLVFGRGPGADVLVDDEYASPRHCRIWREGGRYFVEDLGSTNGTRVRREGRNLKAQPSLRLLPGDVVIVGRTQIPWGGDGTG